MAGPESCRGKERRIDFYARLGDGGHAYAILSKMLAETSLHPNQEDSDRVPSFDGNQGIQGITAGIAEMLLQSHDGELHLLPALPKTWPSGHVGGLRARGGFLVDLDWKDGRLMRTRVHSVLGHPCVLRYADRVVRIDTRPGGDYLRNG